MIAEQPQPTTVEDGLRPVEDSAMVKRGCWTLSLNVLELLQSGMLLASSP